MCVRVYVCMCVYVCVDVCVCVHARVQGGLGGRGRFWEPPFWESQPQFAALVLSMQPPDVHPLAIATFHDQILHHIPTLHIVTHTTHPHTTHRYPTTWGVFHGPLFGGDCQIARPHNGRTSRPHQHNSTLDGTTQNTYGVGKLPEAKWGVP